MAADNMWQMKIMPTFYKSFHHVDPEVRKTIAEFLEEHHSGIDNPFKLTNIKKLTGWPSCYRLRFANYRVGVELDRKGKIILFRYVGTRGDFYKHFPG
ncbi:MAG: type II toxin-antitoxin system RelE/ParE family toxin [Deltaproteobacteria bacterium]|nr:type II toxin-antitoxin system RelE/ParE family toxin [Deltaproteobacteria bacterium]MBF0524827.1 type II toxin-antitoxin system RelE/ParE family toxin [Deltaproteobacteria bacterium]